MTVTNCKPTLLWLWIYFMEYVMQACLNVIDRILRSSELKSPGDPQEYSDGPATD